MHAHRPSQTRWVILALLFAISIVTYIDRVNISVTARQMMPALGLSNTQMGQIFSAFVIGYALFQIPGGWLGDRWGARLVLTVAVVWWSIFTAFTAVAATWSLASVVGIFGSLFVVRFLIGVGEAAALPNFNRAVANWLSPQERGLGIGIAIAGIGIGSAITPPITAWIMVNFGWQMAFYAAAGLGLVVAGLWFLYATDRPSDHPHVNALEAAGEAARGAVAYVTLEPCSHHGKTPPCASALIDAGIAEVVVALRDPASKYGIDAMQKAGIEVRTGLMQADAEKLNEGFLSRIVRKRAFVRLKIAASLDGATAM
ncbi:MAG: MFS transporter, partial [Gemmatimonadales bacterium]